MTDQLLKIIIILFQRVPVERILTSDKRQKVFYDQFDEAYLQDLMLTYHQQYSDTELAFQLKEVRLQMEHTYGKDELEIQEGKRKFNVFSVLRYYVPSVLTIFENKIVCKYSLLQTWRDLSLAIGEELPVLVMAVESDLALSRERWNFAWAPVIGHNNQQLNRILDKGMAENHFHLRGSSPYFQISWMNLMNMPWKCENLRTYGDIDLQYRDKIKRSETRLERQPLYIQVSQAALIRFYLYTRLTGIQVSLEDRQEDSDEIRETANWQILLYMLGRPEYLDTHLYRIQNWIDSVQYHGNGLDYMLQSAPDQCLKGEEEYLIFSGERWFIYSMLRHMFQESNEFSREEYNLFYAYLRIKNEIRGELIQTNELVGFENFQIYQNRKDWFVFAGSPWRTERLLSRLAILDVLNNPAVRFLEVRISPGKTAEEDMRRIKMYDHAVREEFWDEPRYVRMIKRASESHFDSEMDSFPPEDPRNRFYYVFHFPKRKEDPLSESIYMECRHFKYRRTVWKEAEEILRFRREYPRYARRVVGIDACAQEIGCRPEVFGPTFRMLKNYTDPLSFMPYQYTLSQLKITYHVGEDFLDVVDGLRAIDEAVRFLNLDCGDRLGHALALGIDVGKWYKGKNYQITLPLQDYLDNIVWFHHVLVKYDIREMAILVDWLKNQYSHYFSYIYKSGIKIMQGNETIKNENMFQSSFDIETYYLSWLLRGDWPELYKTGEFEWKRNYVELGEQYAVNLNRSRSDDIRNVPGVTLLYYMYHYDKSVRENGSETKTFSIPEIYVEGVMKVQKAMQEDIAERGIAIETNPSSNVKIGTFRSYQEHPITKFYNFGLTFNEEELRECPQINVSINTDDKGVFSTRLENEYAILAQSLEQVRLLSGEPKYRRESIYQWLDNIREMGIRQAFVPDHTERW